MTIMVEFVIFADDFPIDIVAEKIGIDNYEYTKKGDIVFYGENKELHRKEDCTSILYSTGYVDTNDVKKPIENMYKMLLPVCKQISDCVDRYKLNTKFCIVINLTDNPVIELSQEFVKLASKIHAFIEFDSYVNYDDNGKIVK